MGTSSSVQPEQRNERSEDQKGSPVKKPRRSGGSQPRPIYKAEASSNPISGTYASGEAGGERLVLRVDLDNVSKHSPVLNIISGDIFQGASVKSFRTKKLKNINLNQGSVVEVTSIIVLEREGNDKTTAKLAVKISKTGTAEVELMYSNGEKKSYICKKKSKFFRCVNMDIDYATDDLNLPSFNTNSLKSRPPDLENQDISLFSILEDAGIELKYKKGNSSKVEDPDKTTGWTIGEMKEMMETYHDNTDPEEWNVWFLIGTRYRRPNVKGIMFDTRGRQGFAVFTQHTILKDMADTGKSKEAEKRRCFAARQFLHTFAHELGHSFNLIHSWDENKPDSCSYMNYIWKYNRRNGEGSYFQNFKWQYDENELMVLRHGSYNIVKPGASSFRKNVKRDLPELDDDDDDLKYNNRIKFDIKSNKSAYAQMEMVTVEARLKSLYKKAPIYVDARLNTLDNVTIYITNPKGEVSKVTPVAHFLESEFTLPLYPQGSKEGPDRYSEIIPLVYGGDGFYFREPGKYRIRAVYQAGPYFLRSNTVKIEVKTYEGDNTTMSKFFSDEMGEYIAIGGSAAPKYEGCRFLINQLSTKGGNDQIWASEIAGLVGENLSSTKRTKFERGEAKIIKCKEVTDRSGIDKEVLESTQASYEFLHQKGTPNENILYRQVVMLRARIYVDDGKKENAEKEVKDLLTDLKSRGVRPTILQDVENEWKEIKGEELPKKSLEEKVKDIFEWKGDDDKLDEEEEAEEESGLGQKAVFSLFDHEHNNAAVNVIAQIMNKADDTQDIDAVLDFIQSLQKSHRYNRTVVLYAAEIFLTHHPLARRNHLKVPENIDHKSEQDMSTLAMVPHVGVPEEIWIDYWRNDADFTEHHRHWHNVYNARGLPGEVDEHLDRQGELFGYMHQQMLARYDAEREAWGLDPVQPWSFTDVDPLGSDMGDDFHASPLNSRYRPRAPNTRWTSRDVARFRGWETSILQAIEDGVITGPRWSNLRIELNSNDDLENPTFSSANWMGHIIEPSSYEFSDVYGSIHNSGHVVFGSYNQPRGFSGYMSTPTHAVRDHIFYRWHRFVDNLLYRFSETRVTELAEDAPQVLADNVIITRSENPPQGFDSWGGNGWQANFQSDTIGTELNIGQFQFEWGKLTHEPFNYHIRLRRVVRASQQMSLTVRIFICPQRHVDDRRKWIEMDKFVYIMPAGSERAVLSRKDRHSSVIRRRPEDMQDNSIERSPTASGFCECGWPYNLLLPCGTAIGEPYAVMAFLSDNNADRIGIRSSCGSLSYCGARDNRYPDRRQMGYPLATPIFYRGQRVSVSEAASRLDNMTIGNFTIRNSDIRFGPAPTPPTPTPVPPGPDVSEPQADVVAWNAASQIDPAQNVWTQSRWTGRFRVLIDGDNIEETNTFSDRKYIRLRFEGRGGRGGTYQMKDVTLYERSGNTLNVRGEALNVTFSGQSIVTVPEEGITSDQLEFEVKMNTDYFLTFTLDAPGIYLIGRNGTSVWRMANPDSAGSTTNNWNEEEDQITNTRRNIYCVNRLFVNQ